VGQFRGDLIEPRLGVDLVVERLRSFMPRMVHIPCTPTLSSPVACARNLVWLSILIINRFLPKFFNTRPMISCHLFLTFSRFKLMSSARRPSALYPVWGEPQTGYSASFASSTASSARSNADLKAGVAQLRGRVPGSAPQTRTLFR